MAAKPKKPFLSVDLAKNAGKFVATDWDEAIQWVDAELAEWDWLEQASRQLNMKNTLFGSYNGKLNQIRDAMGAARTESGSDVANENITTRIREYSSELIPSSSPEGKFVINLKGEAPRVAAATLAVMLDNLQPNQPDRVQFIAIRGQIEAILFRYGISEKVQKAISGSLEAIATEYGNRLEQDRGKFVQLFGELEITKQAVDEALLNKKAAADEALRKGKAEANKNWGEYQKKTRKDIKEAIDSLKATEDAYKEHMQLAAPVDYWKSKSTEHSESEKNYRKWLIGYSAVGGVVVLVGLFCLARYGIDISKTPNAEFNQTSPAVYFILATMGLVGTTIAFWIARVLVRLYMSEHHLAIDSAERAIMVQTYLALIAESAAGEEERQLILGALFRPTSDGIVRDDVAPDTSFAGLASRVLDRSR